MSCGKTLKRIATGAVTSDDEPHSATSAGEFDGGFNAALGAFFWRQATTVHQQDVVVAEQIGAQCLVELCRMKFGQVNPERNAGDVACTDAFELARSKRGGGNHVVKAAG